MTSRDMRYVNRTAKSYNAGVEAGLGMNRTKRNVTGSTGQVACCCAPTLGTAERRDPVLYRLAPREPGTALVSSGTLEECSVSIVAGTV